MKLAIIGASIGQYPLCLKARELGVETFCFAWEKGAICKDIVDHFYPIDIFDTEKIVSICKEQGVQGVASNGSEVTALVQSHVAEILKLNATSYKVFKLLQNKYYVRQCLDDIKELCQPKYYKYQGKDEGVYPCVVKPCFGGGKKGVTYVDTKELFVKAIAYASKEDDKEILVEEYIEGDELSVETISYHGKHEVVQITQKDKSQPPHFAETGHHQPANISKQLWGDICDVVIKILTKINFTDGASHIELKYNASGIYVIEVNPRGGGGNISSVLTYLSSGVDYLDAMIKVALDNFQGVRSVKKTSSAYSGIYFLCKQSSTNLPLFTMTSDEPWIVEKNMEKSFRLEESVTNHDKKTYLIYQSNHKIGPITSHVFLLKDFNCGKTKFIDFIKLWCLQNNIFYNKKEYDEIWNSSIILAYIINDEIKSCVTIKKQQSKIYLLEKTPENIIEEISSAKQRIMKK